MKNILITGCAGFIGFHLACFFKKRGDKVVGLDNFNDYYSPKLKRDRSHILNQIGINVLEGDVCESSLLQQIVTQHEVTHLVHLAAQAGVRYSLVNPQAYVKSNLEGFVNILEICRNNPLIKLVYASSSSVYGLNDIIPFAVSDRTDQQASLYGVTKKTNELMANTYHHLFGIPSVGLRFFTVYGPWGRPDMAYFTFTKAILEGKPIPIFNEGKMMRDFTFIDDIVEGTAAAADLNSSGCRIFNLGNHQPVELLYFVKILENAIGKKADLEFLPMQQGDVVKTYADIAESQRELGFFPKTPLEVGLPYFVQWYLKHRESL